jgi:C1A family cysteine protease
MKYSLGWRPDLPDFRDYTDQNGKTRALLQPLGVPEIPQALKPFVDNRQFCSPIDDQGGLGSCTAHMGVGMLEYCEFKSFKKFIHGSRLFVYKATRDYAGYTGDSGAEIRNTLGALALYGVPAERLWPYTDDQRQFDIKPPVDVYIAAQSYQAAQYVRLDYAGINNEVLLHKIKAYLVAGFPVGFGFSVYKSIDQADHDGRIPFPGDTEEMEGGHAIMMVGFDDSMVIPNNVYSISTRGAFLIRNSWGTGWGDKGYGWLPYDYVLRELAEDFWVLLKTEWLDTQQFGFKD